jgi:hypothetical protein
MKWQGLRVSIRVGRPEGKGVPGVRDALRAEFAVILDSLLDIRRPGGRLSCLPGERLFPLYWLSAYEPGFHLHRLLHLASTCFQALLLDQFVQGHPCHFIPTVVYSIPENPTHYEPY